MYIFGIKTTSLHIFVIHHKLQHMKTLTQSQLKVIMWYKVRNLFKEERLNSSKIAVKLGIDRRTVKRYLFMSEKEFSLYIASDRQYERKLNPYYSFVKNLLELDCELSASAIEDRLKEAHPDFPVVSSKTVYNFVEYVRKKDNIPRNAEDIRVYEKIQELDYGYEAQVDFGECWMSKDDGGRKKIYFFAMVLCRSRYKFVRFQDRPYTGKDAVVCHDMAFSYFQGIPQRLLYDQDSLFIINENLGDYLLTNDFGQYRDERKLNVVFCRKADPESKGKIENVVKFIKNNFLRARTLYDTDRLNQEALDWLERTGNGKEHAGTRRIPKEEWVIEREYLRLFEGDYYTMVESARRYTVRKDNSVNYRSCWYSLPLGTYKGKGTEVLLKEEKGILLINDVNGSLLASHPVSQTQGVFVCNTSHRRDRTVTLEVLKDEVVTLYSGSDILKNFIFRIQRHKSRYVRENLTVLRAVLTEYNKDEIDWSLTYCTENKLWNSNKLKEAAEHYRKQSSALVSITKHHYQANIKTQINVYDKPMYTPSVSDINIYDHAM